MDQLTTLQARQAAETAEMIMDVIEPMVLRIRREMREQLATGLAAGLQELRRNGTATLSLARRFAQGIAYPALTLALHRGGLWQAIEDTTEEPPANAWRLVAAGIADITAFVDAENPRAFTLAIETSDGLVVNLEHRIAFPIHRGCWEHGRTYAEADEVAWLGCTWRARRATASEPPGADWLLVAKAGERGRQGAHGPMGPPGRDGIDGRNPRVSDVVEEVIREFELARERDLAEFTAWLDKQHLTLHPVGGSGVELRALPPPVAT